jgi:hypothetical protein
VNVTVTVTAALSPIKVESENLPGSLAVGLAKPPVIEVIVPPHPL